MGRVSVPEDVAFTEVGGEAVLVNLASGVYFGLDAVGTQMWEVLSRCGDVEAALPELLNRFDVAPDRLRDDLARFVAELTAHGLLVEAASPPPEPGAETR